MISGDWGLGIGDLGFWGGGGGGAHTKPHTQKQTQTTTKKNY